MNIDLLKRLCETPGVSGREERVRALIEEEIKGLFDEVETDPLGSLICRRHPRSETADGEQRPLRVMLLCHMDEIGFYVSHIDDKGFLWLDPAGGFDPRNLFSRRVLVCTDDGDRLGVMNPCTPPIHLSEPEDRKKVPDLKDFYVDLGLPKKKVEKHVRVGDYVVMHEPFAEVGDKLVSKALDNRIACWLGIEIVRKLHKNKTPHSCEIVVTFTSQEEVGLRGARSAAFAVRPDVGIGLDVTLACDTPTVADHEQVTVQGKGFALHVKDASFIADHGLVKELEAVAKKNKIPYQRSILRRGGQDGAAAQQAAAGAKAIGVTVGTRYIHTVIEMIDRGDLQAAHDVLAAYLASATHT